MGDSSFPPTMSVDEVFYNFKCRREGVVKALTTDIAKLFCVCDPEKKNLCLYGLPNGLWEVNLPSEQVPPVFPEPALGINFARDEMELKDWLRLLAVHSDAWLISVAFYYGARYGFDQNERNRLFELINELPAVFEVVTRKQQKTLSTTIHGNMPHRSESHPKRVMLSLPPKDGEGAEKEKETLCGACGAPYSGNEFWIFCAFCNKWYQGKCVKITPTMAERIRQYKCPSCAGACFH